MIRAVLRSVIHNATVTSVSAAAPVSLRIDPVILRAAEIVPLESVEIVDLATGYRLRTWAEPADEGSGTVRLHRGPEVPIGSGSIISILCFGFPQEGQMLDHRAREVTLNGANQVVSIAES